MRQQQENRLKSEFALFQSLLRFSLHTCFVKCRQTQLELQGSQQIFKQEVITDKVGGSSAKPEVSKQSKEKRLKHKVSGYKSQSKRRSIAGCRLLLRTLELNSYGTYPRTYPSFKREIRFSSLLVYVLHKTRNWAFSRRSNANTAKKCTKSVMHVQSCCFDVLFAVVSLDEWIFKSLQLRMTCTFPLHCPINAEDDAGYLQAIRSENSAIHVVMISSTMT